MPRIVTIVEGQGEVAALPVLLRRIAGELGVHVDVPPPIRVGRHKIVKFKELERAVELAARRAGPAGGILVLLDADRDCPGELGPELLRRARAERPDRAIRVVLAKTEFEAWFVAAAESIGGQRDIQESVRTPPDPESIVDAKAWITRNMSHRRSYRSTRDQPALTGLFDLESARTAPSFDKLWRDVVSLLESSPR